jgi:hypothetical protein
VVLSSLFWIACQPSKSPPEPVPGNPLNFSATDGTDCVYHSGNINGTNPNFTLGGASTPQPAITLSASYPATGSYESPPNSMEILYGDRSAPKFTTGVLSLYPPPSTVTVKENKLTSWTVTWSDPTRASVALPYGLEWQIVFSCGAIPQCCANTTKVDFGADGTP